jgi:hypothetical protein
LEERTEEELAKIAEKRKEQGRKLQEIAAKTRVEKARSPFVLGIKEILMQMMYSLCKRRTICNIC